MYLDICFCTLFVVVVILCICHANSRSWVKYKPYNFGYFPRRQIQEDIDKFVKDMDEVFYYCQGLQLKEPARKCKYNRTTK